MDNDVFITERLRIRPTSMEDAEFIFELMNTPKWLRYIGDRNIRNTNDAKEYIKNKMLPQFNRLGYSNYTVIRKKDHAKIGTCGLYDREGVNGIDLGFAFLPEYEKKGYAYESAKAITHASKKVFNLKHLKAITTPENRESQKLLTKLGFTLEDTIQLKEEELLLFKKTFNGTS